MRRLLLLTLAALVVLAPAIALASPQDTANEIAHEIMSPYCPAVTLHDCPSPAAAKMRDRIVGWAEDGWSKDRILDHLETQWGDVIKATPPTEGAGLLAWALPGLAVLCGAIGVFFVTRSWSKRRRRMPPPLPISSGDRSRLDKELARVRTES